MRLILIIAIAALLHGCTREEALPVWRLSDATVKIGSADGDTSQILHQVVVVHEDTAGRLFVLQFGSPTVAVFDHSGNRDGTLGGSGGGPADFSLPNMIQTRADTIWVADSQLGKLARFTAAMLFVESAPLNVIAPNVVREGGLLGAIGYTPAGELLLTVRARDTVFWHLGDQPEPLMRIATTATVGRARIGQRHISIVQPFTDDALVAVHPDREALFTLRRDSDVVTIEVRDFTGSAIKLMSVPSTPQEIREDQISPHLDRFAEPMRGTGTPMPEVRDALRRALYIPRVSHGIVGLHIARDSLLAVIAQRPQPDCVRATVLDYAKGVPVGMFCLPDGSRMMSYSDDYVWLLERGDHDVELLVRRRVERD